MSSPARFGVRSQLAIAAAFALLLTPIAAQLQSQPVAGYRIAGRVVNSTTGAPVPRATVSALSEEDNRVVATTVADSEGSFAIAGLPQGKYPLTASRRGYRTAYYDEHEESFNTAIVTGPGQDTGHLVFRLAPAAVIYGVITGDGGDPVENAQVMLFRLDPAAPGQPPARAAGASTDDIGAFEFSDLSAGEYFLAVQARPWYAMNGLGPQSSTAENSLDVAYPITFYDSTTDEAAATPLQVDAGSRTEADISLHAVPALHLSIPRPAQNDNGPGFQVQQSLFGTQISAPLNIESVGRGPWDVSGLAPGHYEVITNDPPRTMEVDATSSMEINPASGAPSQPVDGALRMADGAEPPHLGFSLTRFDGGGIGLFSPITKGRFHFDVPPGTWTLTPTALVEGVLAASIAVNGVPIAGNQITVRDQPLTLAVTLSRSQAQITGFARSGGKPAPGAMIVLVPRDPAAWPALARRDQSDSDGSFSLGSVPPGRYTVVAIVDGWKLNWQDRAVIARYLRGGESVTINAQTAGVVTLPQPVQIALP
jgi:hypothetical protein